MVDYSKWDKMANEVDDEETKSGQPRVTTLRQPQSITIGKDGYSFGPPRSQKAAKPSKPASARPGALDYSKWDHIGDDDSDGGGGGGGDDDDDDDDDDDAAAADEGYPEAPARTLPPAASTSAAAPVTKAPPTLADTLKLLSRDGGRTAAYVWSQDRREVVVNVLVPPKATAKEVRVSIDELSIAMGVSETRMLVTHAGSKLVDGKLAYECKPFENDDWELVDLKGDPDGRRIVRITLTKAAINAEIVTWWRRILDDEAPIDVSAIQARDAKGAAQLQSAWAAAHDAFKQKVQSEMDEDGDEDED
jgi:hypothetical protein